MPKKGLLANLNRRFPLIPSVLFVSFENPLQRPLLSCLDSPIRAPWEERFEGWHLFHTCFCSSCRRPSSEISCPSCRRPGPLRPSPPLSQPRQWWPAKLTHGSFVDFPDNLGQKVEEGGRSCQRGLDQQPTQLSAPPKYKWKNKRSGRPLINRSRQELTLETRGEK